MSQAQPDCAGELCNVNFTWLSKARELSPQTPAPANHGLRAAGGLRGCQLPGIYLPADYKCELSSSQRQFFEKNIRQRPLETKWS